MFGRHRKALADNRIAELQMDNERLERTVMGLRRERDLALCPISGIRQRAYQEGLTEGMHRGRVQAQQARQEQRPHQHDFAELETRVLANMLAQGDTYFGEGFVRGRWRSSYASLQNLPRRQPPKLIGLTIEHNGKAYRWVVGDKDIVGLKTSPGYKDNSKLKVFVYFEGGNFSTTTFDKNLFTQPVTYLWEEQ